MAQGGQGEMFPSPPAAEGLVVINQRCQFRTQDGHRVVMASGLILAQYAVGDRMSTRRSVRLSTGSDGPAGRTSNRPTSNA